MPPVRASTIPDTAFLAEYARAKDYTDCYSLVIGRDVPLSAYIAAFYTTPVFKFERLILSAAGRPSSDAVAERLAAGGVERFAAWAVESRANDQILLAAGRTRSWLMVRRGADGHTGSTTLYFGSAIVRDHRGELGWSFKALLGFHKAYSRVLLRAAGRRLRRS